MHLLFGLHPSPNKSTRQLSGLVLKALSAKVYRSEQLALVERKIIQHYCLHQMMILT